MKQSLVKYQSLKKTASVNLMRHYISMLGTVEVCPKMKTEGAQQGETMPSVGDPCFYLCRTAQINKYIIMLSL